MKASARWLLLIPVLLVAIGLGVLVPRLLDNNGDDDPGIVEEAGLSTQDEERVSDTLNQIEDYEKLLEATPDDTEVLKPLADNYFILAEIEVKNGLTNDSFEHYKAAVDNYRKVLVLQPDNAAVRLSLGLSYDGLLMRPVAYRELRAVKTSDPATLFDLASAFSKVGLFSEARQSLDAIQTDDPDLLVNVALEYAEQLQLYPEAEAAAVRATQLAPDNQRAWLTLGYILKSAGREEEAMAALEKTIEIDPGSAIAEEAQSFIDR